VNERTAIDEVRYIIFQRVHKTSICTGCSKVDRQLSREYFTSDAIYNVSAGMTLYYYMCRSSKTVAGEGRNGLGHPYQLNQSTLSADV
jgi:hypothetical protein